MTSRPSPQSVSREADIAPTVPPRPALPHPSPYSFQRLTASLSSIFYATPSTTQDGPSQPTAAQRLEAIAGGSSSTQPSQQGATFFPQANNFHLENFVYNEAPANPGSTTSMQWDRGWEQLMTHTAPNALYNSKARYDPPKCDEDTRVEVIREVMDWMTDRETASTRLLCMTGAAGAGKSALQQTIAERCVANGILASTFFFWKADHTRNNVSGIVATIAYQLGLKHIGMRRLIGAAMCQDPLIFDQSLITQMESLIVKPVKIFRATNGEQAARELPYAIFIDGLDECEDVDQQEALLDAIKESFLDNDHTYFRIFISSRPEWAIRTALEGPLATQHYHIPLSDRYDATADIRRYLWRRLREIGLRSGDPRARKDWPVEEDVEFLVKAASGQFIYAAIVIKYISERRTSPFDRLRVILTWRPAPEQRAAPFAMLDLLYTNILSVAKSAYEDVDTNNPEDFLPLLLAYQGGRKVGLPQDLDMCDSILGYPRKTHELVMSDLRSVTHVSAGQLHLYHKSLVDFLDSKLRARTLYVSTVELYAFVVRRILLNISGYDEKRYNDRNSWDLVSDLLDVLDPWNLDLKPLINEAGPFIYPILHEFTRRGGWDRVEEYGRFLRIGTRSEVEETYSLNLCKTIGSWIFEQVFPALEQVHQPSIFHVQSPHTTTH
ncbi:hypothetical protein DFP72DRAFT_927206 [Ephemerocybe angulata]|uniref:Nephrocystin 3-like N-terminal domain-containing protein n=1 Tax=Ephemerocybe angulata TaxID=980116 RepID=A0A8H6HDL3_9AGAR|nr:hypothetical protein DFP72DRAFT_927206 [Tulosesus angulatus]